MQIFEMDDTASRIGEVIGTLAAIGVYCLMAYGLYLGLFH
jgi:hypothetical protein